MIRVTPLVIALAVVVSHSAGDQDALLTQRAQNPGLPGPLSAILVKTPAATAIPDLTTGIFVKLLQTAQAPRSTAIQTPKCLPLSGNPKAMTMLAISSQSQTEATRALLIRCRTDGYISSEAWGGRIVMKGVITQDVVSAGKILIAAGSKVTGIGHIDPDSGRLESKGNWSIIADNREVRVHAQVQDAETGFHGLQGKETSFESESSQRQAVVRDSRYCFVADKTPFVLSITGSVSITILQPLESPE
jgi:hypothetical protein